MQRDFKLMEIKIFEKLPSTQVFLLENIKSGEIQNPICILAKTQDSGIGSRNNTWNSVKKGLYCSFALNLDSLPSDLPAQSMAIFFGFIFKESLRKAGSKAWLKYPNDIYLDSQKIGGIMCNIASNFVICGIGMNIQSDLPDFYTLENGIIKNEIEFLKKYFKMLKNASWSEVYRQYINEFSKNYDFYFHSGSEKISLKNAILCEDCAILINGKKYYSIR